MDGLHVELHQDGANRVVEAHSRYAGVSAAGDVTHYAVRELGYVQELSTTTSGYAKAQLPSKKK